MLLDVQNLYDMKYESLCYLTNTENTTQKAFYFGPRIQLLAGSRHELRNAAMLMVVFRVHIPQGALSRTKSLLVIWTQHHYVAMLP